MAMVLRRMDREQMLPAMITSPLSFMVKMRASEEEGARAMTAVACRISSEKGS